jgi:hypothetical protein
MLHTIPDQIKLMIISNVIRLSGGHLVLMVISRHCEVLKKLPLSVNLSLKAGLFYNRDKSC